MSSELIAALPAIHSTFIGLGAAIYCSYVVYVYQRFHVVSDNYDLAVKDLKESSAIEKWWSGTEIDHLFVNDLGELDWRATHSFLNDAVRLGFKPSDERVVQMYEGVFRVLSLMFVSYPMNGEPHVDDYSISENHKQKKLNHFTRERVEEIRKRLRYLPWYFKNYEVPLRDLARRYVLAKENEEVKRQARDFPHLGVEGELMLRAKPRSFDAESTLFSYKDDIMYLWLKVFPRLDSSVSSYDKCLESFPLKKLSLFLIGSFVCLLLFGVVAPLLLDDLYRRQVFCYYNWVGYGFVAMTFAPYVWGAVAMWCWVRVSRLN